MAVRHLKRYASWVQTVQHLIQGPTLNRELNGLNPEANVTYVETYGAINDNSRRSHVGIRVLANQLISVEPLCKGQYRGKEIRYKVQGIRFKECNA